MAIVLQVTPIRFMDKYINIKGILKLHVQYMTQVVEYLGWVDWWTAAVPSYLLPKQDGGTSKI